MNLPTFAIAIVSLLILPGPTNAVLALASTALTLSRCLSLVAAVVSAYLVVIVPVSGIAAPFLNGHPGIAGIVKLISASWVLYLALKLLVPAPAGGQNRLGAGQLFVTTLLNPKAMLYFGSILSQAVTPDLGGAHLALVWTLLVAESLLWFALVATLFSAPRMLQWLRTRLRWFDRAIGVVLLGLAAKVGSSGM